MTNELIYTKEINIRIRKNRINKLILGVLLFITLSAFALKIIDGIMLDLGYGVDEQLDNIYKYALISHKFDSSSWFKELDALHKAPGGFKINSFHLSFWSNTSIAQMASDKTIYLNGKPMTMFKPLIMMLDHHPSSIWLLTQFTWITTIIIALFLVFRFFKYTDTLPKWLKWIMTQRTLSLVTIYSSIVGIVFWIGMFNDFDKAFNGSLKALELMITIIVHAIIPVLMIIYSIVYLVKDKHASALRESLILKSLLYPTLYIVWYLLLTIIWYDPYAITTMHDSLMKTANGQTLSGHNWWSELWKLGVVMIGMWMLIGIMILTHNLLLLKFNKNYNPKKDYETIQLKKRKIEKIKNKITRKYNRKMTFDVHRKEPKVKLKVKPKTKAKTVTKTKKK